MTLVTKERQPAVVVMRWIWVIRRRQQWTIGAIAQRQSRSSQSIRFNQTTQQAMAAFNTSSNEEHDTLHKHKKMGMVCGKWIYTTFTSHPCGFDKVYNASPALAHSIQVVITCSR
jgi:hypothetical protein